MTKLPTAARIAHDLGLAACFGGTLFGKVVFNPSIGVIESPPQRGKVGGTAWNRFNVINATSFVAAAATWLPGRLELSTGDMDRRTRDFVLAKDALMGAASTAGLAALIVQILLNRQAPQNAVPLKTGGAPAPEAGPKATVLQRAVGALAGAGVALFAALVAVTAMLSKEAAESASRSVVSRLLP